jgi:hypothetical protein
MMGGEGVKWVLRATGALGPAVLDSDWMASMRSSRGVSHRNARYYMGVNLTVSPSSITRGSRKSTYRCLSR